jgi:hypothetical protein
MWRCIAEAVDYCQFHQSNPRFPSLVELASLLCMTADAFTFEPVSLNDRHRYECPIWNYNQRRISLQWAEALVTHIPGLRTETRLREAWIASALKGWALQEEFRPIMSM